jgi:hypothetical protein
MPTTPSSMADGDTHFESFEERADGQTVFLQSNPVKQQRHGRRLKRTEAKAKVKGIAMRP